MYAPIMFFNKTIYSEEQLPLIKNGNQDMVQMIIFLVILRSRNKQKFKTMKKSILLIFVIALYFNANAQIHIGGSVGFSSDNSKSTSEGTTVEEPSSTYIKLMPDVEYMLADNFSVGGQIGFSFNKTKDAPDDTETALFMFEIAPYTRMYFPLSENIEFFGEGGIGFARGTEKITVEGTSNDGNTYTDFSLGVAPGLRYAISEKLKLELRAGYLGYGFSSIDDNDDPETVQKNNKFGFNLNLSTVAFGIKYTL